MQRLTGVRGTADCGRRRAAGAGSRDAARPSEAEEGEEEVSEDYRPRLPEGSTWRLWKAVTAGQAAARSEGGSDTAATGSIGGSGSEQQRVQQRGEQAGGSEGAADEGPGEAEEEEQRRSSPIVELSMLLAECVQHGLRTIAFCNSRWVGGWVGESR